MAHTLNPMSCCIPIPSMVGGHFLLDISCRNLHVSVKLQTSWADALHHCIYVVAGMPPPKFTHISFVARKVFHGHASLNACSKLHYRINFLLIGHICCCYHIQFALWEDQLYDTGKQKQLWAVGMKYKMVIATPKAGMGLNARNHRVTFRAGLQYV